MKTQPRIAIAGISHETNTYCHDLTRHGDFRQLRGEQIYKTRGTETSLSGALHACETLGFEPVPILAVSAQPSGVIEREAYDHFKQEILAGLEANKPVDGIYLELHGAGVVEGIMDLEADLARSVRDCVGEAVPITASFDLHGNISQTMADALDGIFACHHYPHIDMYDRAIEAVELIGRMLMENFRPICVVEKIPMLTPTTTTFEGIGKEMLAEMLDAENETGVIDVSWFHGFPYTDVPHIGAYIVVTMEDDRQKAEQLAKRLARILWQQREAFRPISLSADEAITKAESYSEKPVVINETSDNCGGGTPGDGTHLLRAMIERKLPRACFGFIVDELVAMEAHQAGVGATIKVSLGARYDELHGAPLELSVYVKALHDGKLVMQAMGKGSPLHLGKIARLVVDGIDIIVASRRSQTFDPGPFEALGINVNEYPIVALKSSNHFRAGFQSVAKAIVTADTPGLTTHQVSIFPRQHATQPLWPTTPSASYDEGN